MLAIVIPYYKSTFFESTLKSLACQTDKRFHVYICNDASPNTPESLIDKYKDQITISYKAHETNLGGLSLTAQWGRSIDMINDEEWIMILGDDDVLGANVVESFYETTDVFNKKNINVVKFASKLIDNMGRSLSDTFYHAEFELATDAYYRKYIWESRSSLSEYIFRKSSYENFGFTNYPLGWHSDDKAWLDFSKGTKIFTINKAVLEIRRSKENISGKTDNMLDKNKASRLFLKDIILDSSLGFSHFQKIFFLFEYGALMKNQNKILLSDTIMIFIQFLKIGSVYNGFRFLRRMFRAKFLNK